MASPYEAPVVFITGYTHEQMPDAGPRQIGFHNRLANAVAAVTPPRH